LSGFKSKLKLVLISCVLIFLSAEDCLAQPQAKTDSSFWGALLTFLILSVLCGGIFFALKIHSLLKGGELSYVWILSSLALSILFVSILLELLNNLGIIIDSLPTLVLLLQLLGFSLLVFGILFFKKKLS
jgi:uncharacterized membrane protein